jgi:hypothetical protein
MHPAYRDFGPPTLRRKGHGPLANPAFSHRPYCDLCGPFRGRYLRTAGTDEFGTLWRCASCDGES